jgi:hypothetical protein
MSTPDSNDENVVRMPEPDGPGEAYVVLRIAGQAFRARVNVTVEDIGDKRADVLPIAALTPARKRRVRKT